MEAKSSKSSFCGAYWRWRKHTKEARKTDGTDSISIFSSSVWTNIFWCTVLKITTTQSIDFVTAKNTEIMEPKWIRVGLHKCCTSHHIKKWKYAISPVVFGSQRFFTVHFFQYKIMDVNFADSATSQWMFVKQHCRVICFANANRIYFSHSYLQDRPRAICWFSAAIYLYLHKE